MTNFCKLEKGKDYSKLGHLGGCHLNVSKAMYIMKVVTYLVMELFYAKLLPELKQILIFYLEHKTLAWTT